MALSLQGQSCAARFGQKLHSLFTDKRFEMSVSGLNTALSGLRIAQQQMNVISNNISNVSTPGYSRKILPQETSVILGQGAGVLSNPVIREVDLNLERDLWTQVSATSFFSIKESYMTQIQQFHGPPDKELSIAAEIARLRDSFVQLSNSPDDNTQLELTVNKAEDVAEKFNDFSSMLTQMRNDTQQKVSVSVENANRLLVQIADLNKQIKSNLNLGRTTAELEDQRDSAIKELSHELQISFFIRGDGVLVVQTSRGQQLADENATEIFFDPIPVGTASYYPASVAGIYIGGNPVENPTAFDLTPTDIGGRIGAYIDIRDNTLPQYQAQLDELAYRIASRFDAQGVRLFTDDGGQIPADTAPVPNPPGPLTPVSYVGYASTIQVNDAIVDDNTLLRTSTLTGVNVQQGSSEFLRRVVEFTFGEFEYLEAQGNVDVRVAALPDTLQNVLGLDPLARVVGDVDIRTLSLGGALNTAPNNPFLPPTGPPLLDDFTLRFDPGGVNDTGAITIDLGTVDGLYPTPPALSGADALVTYLNTDIIPLLAPPLNNPGVITIQLNQFGQMVIDSQYGIEIGTGTMGDDGLEYLGLEAGTTTATSPYFDIQVGKDNPVRIDVDPGDTEISLLAKLNAVSGVQATVDAGTGFLNIRPGPNFGGDIRLIDGPVFSSGGNSILTELFGSSNVISGVDHASFRETELGPDVTRSTNIIAPDTLIDFSQKMVNTQTEDANVVTSTLQDEQSFHDLLERQLLDESSVNIDEELAQLIVIQTAYSAAAKTVSTINDMFRELIDAF